MEYFYILVVEKKSEENKLEKVNRDKTVLDQNASSLGLGSNLKYFKPH